MPYFLSQLTTTDLLVIAVGVALLAYGRRLYWLALGTIGFFGGLWFANQWPAMESTHLSLGLSFLIGILGAVLAVLAQRMAIAFGGFVIGGSMAYWTAAWLTVPTGWPPGPWLWAIALLGAVIGTFFAAVLFEASLLALTSLFGALLVAKASHVGAPHESWLFLLLLAAGMIAQSSPSRRSRGSED